MSLTPLDESDRKHREGGRSADDGSDDGGPGILGRVRDVLGRVAAVLSGRSEPQETTTAIESHGSSSPGGFGEPERAPVARSPSGSDARAAERSLTWASPSSEGPPEPEDPVDRPELVASWDARGLTLSEQGDSGRTLSSDTWTDVER
jgi:hypothetical protein